MRQSLIAVGMFLLTGGMVGCGTSSTQEKEDLIVVDVSKDYPKKELILQDLFDVEYIPLETTDEFVTLGWLQAIGKDVMIIRNMWAVDGDIFIYDRKGKAIRHINRKGQGNEEYAATSGVYLDDEKGEIFVGNIPIVDAHSISRLRRRTWSLEICSSSYPSKTGASRKR